MPDCCREGMRGPAWGAVCSSQQRSTACLSWLDMSTRGGVSRCGSAKFVSAIHCVSDSSSARITIAQWLTPNRSEIHKVGITPKHVVPYAADAKYRLELPQKLSTDPISVDDSQLWWGLKLLTSAETPPPPPPPTPTPQT